MMKEKKTFDEIIRKKLEEINSEPPANLWNKIEAGITNVPVEASKFLWRKLFLQISAAIILLGVISTVIYLKIEDRKISSTQPKVREQSFNTSIHTAAKDDNSIKISASKTNSIQHEISNKTANKIDNKTSKILIQLPKKLNSEDKISSGTNTNNQAITNNKTQVIQVKQTIKNEFQSESIQLSETLQANNPAIQKVDSIATKVNYKEEKIQKENINSEPILTNETVDTLNKNKDEKPNPIFRYNPHNLDKYFIGAAYGQEYFANKHNINSVHNFNINLSYQNLNFWAQSGLGISYSKEESNYILEYNRYEFDRSQFETDSVVLGISNAQRSLIQTVVGHTSYLYKDNEYSYNSIANDIYYNLRIPVLLGYRKDFKKMAYHFSCGVAYNLQLHKKTKGLLELDEKSKMISLFYPVKPRRASNLEYLLSGGIAFKIAPRMSFNTELLMRIYQYNLYKNATNDSPTIWSSGLNIGLIYEL